MVDYGLTECRVQQMENMATSAHKFCNLEAQIGHNSNIQCRHGNNLDLMVSDKAFRMYFQNYNGISLHNNGVEFLDELTVLKEIGTSLIEGAESNINWDKGNTWEEAKENIRQVNMNQPHRKYRQRQSRPVAMGYTVWERKWLVMFISAYRVCDNNLAKASPSTC
eukprot:5740985-Ditylum_brightwellii.AAC.1